MQDKDMPSARAAKAYLAQLRHTKAAAGSDDDGDGDGHGNSAAFLAGHLRTEALEAAGRALRPVAAAVNLPEASEGRLLRGHRLAATAVALSADDGTAYTVTKCGAVLAWDVEAGKRCDTPCNEFVLQRRDMIAL